MKESGVLKRRDFLRVCLTAGVELVIGVSLAGCGDSGPTATGEFTPTAEGMPEPTAAPTDTAEPTVGPTDTAEPTEAAEAPATPEPELVFEPDLFVRIANDGTVTVTVHRSEMGQGVRTALPMIVAEELEVDWEKVRVVQAPADRQYGDQTTGGSFSVTRSYSRLRQAGALARQMLIMAAAQEWGVAQDDCYAENGAVVNRTTDERRPYGELVETAISLAAPSIRSVPLKDESDFRIIGQRMGRVDGPDIATGRAVYGLDVRVPGMLYATLARSPVFGGRVASYEAGGARAVPGVRDVVEVDGGIAVIAENTWAAIRGREALEIDWDEGEHADLDDEAIGAMLRAEIESQVATLGESAAPTVEAVYECSYLAHVPMEPMNCVADVREDGCEVWAPTQNPQDAQSRAAGAGGSPARVNVPLIGCGLGRRLENDYVIEAVRISQAAGAPVQVVWTREDDIRHDYLRPRSVHWLRAELDEEGFPLSWTHRIAAQAIHGDSRGITEGARNLPYRIQASVAARQATLPIPTTYFRSVFNGQNAFVNESFIDELAAAAGMDPLAYRLALLPENSAARRVLEEAADRAGWGTPLPDNGGRGIAHHQVSWGGTHVAEVAEVSVEGGVVQVHRVVCAVDCGLVVNPDMVEAQMESGIAVGLSAALHGEITIGAGRVQQSNFHDYPIVRSDEMPVVEVHLVPSDREPQGIGEMGIPQIAPAVANAIFAATGRRLRRLPFQL
jgi:isoquinoline 1-oxidoreductase beta subunit